MLYSILCTEHYRFVVAAGATSGRWCCISKGPDSPCREDDLNLNWLLKNLPFTIRQALGERKVH
jgi:hypothetical protein